MWPFSLIYLVIVNVRNWLYEKQVFRSINLEKKVISVGNLTTGGSGKTPMVELLALYLKKRGMNPAILSRGYGRRTHGIVVVSDGEKLAGLPKIGGDEPALLARHLPGIPVVVARDRVIAGQWAINRYGVDILLMDGGFQHRKLKRDADIVMLDATCAWGNGRVLPGGPLREPLRGLRRADLIIWTRTDETDVDKKNKAKVLSLSRAPVLASCHKPKGWRSLVEEKIYSLDLLTHQKVFGFAGIGNPESFKKKIDQLGIQLVGFAAFRDHHWYSRKEIDWIIEEAARAGADAIVTTEKDGIKVSFPIETEIPGYALMIELEIIDGIEQMNLFLDSVCESNGGGI